MIIVDEAYIDFATKPGVRSAVPLIEAHPNVVVMRTFSKAHALAGLRVGYAIGETEVIGAIQALLVPFGVNSLAQAGALASLKDAEAVDSGVARIVAERERIVPALRALGYDIPDTQSNFYLLRGSVHGLVEASARAGLIVRPFREGVRVSVGSREQNDLFLSVATQFARVEGIGK
jgi:putative phenylalanine aminotransferase